MPEILGHRGTLSHENTIAGLRLALEGGLDGAEIDVRLSADGQVVVFHDANLRRLAGRQGGIETMTWAEIRALRLLNGERIPRLGEVLEMWPAGKRLNVELKFGGRALVAEVLRQLAGRRDVVLSSFVPAMLVAAGDVHERALILAAGSPAELRHDGGATLGCQWVHASADLCEPDQIVHYRGQGLRVGVWGAASAEAEAELARRGVTRIITDFVRR